jgi:hypothetical protein
MMSRADQAAMVKILLENKVDMLSKDEVKLFLNLN